ncbi:MAG TPA: alpha/beta fold hydrolase [Bacteroidia bacterium]|nr:alpha/beta fold hydrolase [Bacteroidia bacterium]
MKKIIFPKVLFTLCIVANISTGIFAQATKREVGNLVMEGIPEIPADIREKMNQYQNTRSASFSDWSADGKSILLSTRFGDVNQLHIIDHAGGARKQITFFKEPVNGGVFIPLPRTQRFMYTKDVGGNEFSQLFVFDLTNGSYKMISDGGRSQNSSPSFSNSGHQFCVVSTRRNGKDYDLYLYDTQTPDKGKIILQNGGSWSVADWSPDDKKMVVKLYISANRSEIYLLDIATGLTEQINKSKEEISYGSVVFSQDGKGLFIVNDEGSEFMTLKYYDIATKKFTSITQSIPWNVERVAENKNRSKIVFSVNNNGNSNLYEMNALTKEYIPINDLPVGVIGGIKFNPVNDVIAMTINSPQSPGDIYTYDLGAHILKQWTFSEVGGLNPNTFVTPTLISYKTFDKPPGAMQQIPAWYYKPKKADAKLPVVILIHGGPEGQSLPTFNAYINYLTNELGIAVIAPNVRGSEGYGKTYLKSDNGFNRENSVKDIGALLDWIAQQPELDASRIAVYGGSYGGYMVLASLTNYNDKLKCGIDVVGISNFVTFLTNTEDYRKDLRRVEYGDEREPKMKEFLTKISPASNASKITKPLFIIQGLNDPRVPASEAEQMKVKIAEKGGEVWYLVAKDEGHGFRKKVNIDFQQWAMILFLQEKLLK